VKARDAFKDHVYYDVKKDHKKLDEMIKVTNGQREVPVIIEGQKVNIGYGGS